MIPPLTFCKCIKQCENKDSVTKVSAELAKIQAFK